MAVVTRSEAKRIINEGGEVFSVFGPVGFTLFDDYDEGMQHADELEAKHHRIFYILDWETGEYA